MYPHVARILMSALVILSASVVNAENLRIGYIGGLTGDSAIIGQEIAATLQVVVDKMNNVDGISGRRVELLVEDDGYDVKRALSAYQKMRPQLNSNVVFMSTYGAVLALGSRPEADGIVVVDTLDCNDKIVRSSSMHTCVATRTESIGEAFLGQIKKAGGGTVGVLYEQEAWFEFIVGTLRSGLGEMLLEVPTAVKSGDYRAEVATLRKANVKHVVVLGNDSMGRALAQARSIGIEAPFYSIAGVMSPGFQELSGKALEGAYVSNWLIPDRPAKGAFSEAFKTYHGRDIVLDFVVGPTRDAGYLVWQSLKSLNAGQAIPSGEEIRRAMSELPSFDGLSGSIDMDQDGAVRSIREGLYQFRDGTLVPLH